MALLNVIASDPTSNKLDLTEFGLDIAKALENLKFSPPIKGQTLSTESWILVSGGTIFFND